jgi:thioredoxin reductase
MQKVAIIGAGHAGLLALQECLSSGSLDPICFEVSFQPFGIYHKISTNLFIDGYKTVGGLIHELEQIPADKIKFGSKVVAVRELGERIEVVVKKRAKKTTSGSELKSSGYSTDNLLSASTPLSPESRGFPEFEQLKGDNSETPNSPPSKQKSYYKRYVVDRVIIATGQAPYLPDFDGMDDYEGKVIHSTEFKVLYPYVGQKILVVGSGPNALQIANALVSIFLNIRLITVKLIYVLVVD